jgi:hypothetical protein
MGHKGSNDVDDIRKCLELYEAEQAISIICIEVYSAFRVCIVRNVRHTSRIIGVQPQDPSDVDRDKFQIILGKKEFTFHHRYLFGVPGEYYELEGVFLSYY